MKTFGLIVTALGALALSGCAGSDAGTVGGDGGFPGDAAPPPCSVAVQLTPQGTDSPRVGVDEAIRATASVLDVGGTVTYAWQVTYNNVPAEFDDAAADASAISIPITTDGPVHVQLALTNHPECPTASGDITVLPNKLATASYRLRVSPPATSGVPAFEQIVQVHGGVDTVFPVALGGGFSFGDGKVVDAGAQGIAAYVRMSPVGAPGAIVEAYTGATGAIPTIHVLGQAHTALIVPSDPSFAPMTVPWTPGTASQFTVGPGTTVTGVVHDPSGAALAGATVALSIGGTPSTVGTTSGSGAFTLHATPIGGAVIAVTVTPPAASGLPRLVASSAALALDQPWTITYASGLATRDLSGVHVTRGGSPVTNTTVAVVGAIAAAGTIAAGATNLTAVGDVRIAAATDGAGALSGRAPAAALALVVTQSSTDVAQAGFDLTAAAPALVATAAPVAVTGLVTAGGAGLDHVRVDATGVGALAGVVVQVVTDATGHYSLPLAAGGAYTTRYYDPAGRGAPLASSIASATSTTLATRVLPTAVHLTGTVTVSGMSPPAGASVQLLCSGCSGADAAVPISETATDPNGRFRLAVPDPSAVR